MRRSRRRPRAVLRSSASSSSEVSRDMPAGYRAAAKWFDGLTALGDIGDIAATIAVGSFACAEVGNQIGPEFGKSARKDARIDTQALEQDAVGVEIRIAGGEKLVAVENRVRAGEVTQRLCRVAELATARRQTKHGLGHGDPCGGGGTHEFDRGERRHAAA